MNTRCWNFTTLTMAALAAFLAGGCGGDPAASLDSGVPVDSAIATQSLPTTVPTCRTCSEVPR